MPVSETYLIDCMEYMAGMPDKYFDLAVVDPPYGININNSIGRRKGDRHSGHKKVLWDSQPPSKEYFKQLIRVSKNQIIWGANHFIDRMPINSPCWLMWDKKFSEEVSFAQFELAWTSFDGTCKKFDFAANKGNKIHPTQKPQALYRWIFQNYAKPGQKIFDSHLGSQSSRLAAWDMGLDFYGCEIDPEYFSDGNARFEAHKNKPVLFAAEQMYSFEQAKLFDQ
jgi:site-specific DNA-methyltransferase (adenine-specific)